MRVVVTLGAAQEENGLLGRELTFVLMLVFFYVTAVSPLTARRRSHRTFR